MRTLQASSAAVAPVRDDGRMILLAIMLAYVSLGTILGFVQGGVAPVLRTHDVALSAMHWVYALYLPFGLAFLWAPIVDAWRWPWLGRRTGWIVPMQGLSVLSVAGAAFMAPAPGAWVPLLALGFIATATAATTDVALDALTVEMMSPDQRAAAAAAKMGGISLGSVLGGGVLVAWYPTLHWQGTLSLIAVIMALSCLPVLTLIGKDRRLSIRRAQQRAHLMQTLHRPEMIRRFIRLTLLVCTLLALFNFNRLLLVDMGVSLERIGSVLGVIAPLANATACMLAPMLVRALPVQRAACLTAGICVASAGLVWFGFLQASVAAVIVGSILTTMGAAALYVVLGSLILEWAADGQQAATDYALLYGVGRLVGTALLVGLPGLIQTAGWSVFLSTVLLAFAGAAWYFMRLLQN